MRHLKKISHEDIFSLCLGALAVLLLAFTSPQKFVSKHEYLLMPPELLKHFTFGYNETSADLLWLRLVQDIDLCSIGNHGITSTSEEETRRIQAKRASGVPICETGWSYHMLDTITELAPKFEAAYKHGGSTLSIVVEDRVGAAKIFEKGLKVFPNDKEILLGAAFHALLEMKQPGIAADYLIRAVHNGAPSWMIALAAKLYSETGRAMMAKVALTREIEKYEAQDPDHRFLPRLKERLAEVEKNLESSAQH